MCLISSLQVSKCDFFFFHFTQIICGQSSCFAVLRLTQPTLKKKRKQKKKQQQVQQQVAPIKPCATVFQYFLNPPTIIDDVFQEQMKVVLLGIRVILRHLPKLQQKHLCPKAKIKVGVIRKPPQDQIRFWFHAGYFGSNIN